MLPLPGHGLEAGFIWGQKPASVCAQRSKRERRRGWG